MSRRNPDLTRRSGPRPVTWLVAGSLLAALATAGLGLLTHSSGTVGAGGVECGSVLFVSAYHSGCQGWLDSMCRVVFGAAGIAVVLLGAGLVRWRSWPRAAWVPIGVLAVALTLIAPVLWRDAVFRSFGY